MAYLPFLLFFFILALSAPSSNSFSVESSSSSKSNNVRNLSTRTKRTTTATTTTTLNADFLSNLFGGGKKEDDAAPEKDPDVPETIFEIPTNNVKIGPVQFLIKIHMVSRGNLPEKGTWVPQQNDKGNLDLYFKDGTGMCTVVITEYMIKAERYGSKQSLQYLLQESLLMHSVLDEIEKTVFDVDDIEEDKRLIRLKEEDGIDKARSALIARPEKEEA